MALSEELNTIKYTVIKLSQSVLNKIKAKNKKNRLSNQTDSALRGNPFEVQVPPPRQLKGLRTIGMNSMSVGIYTLLQNTKPKLRQTRKKTTIQQWL